MYLDIYVVVGNKTTTTTLLLLPPLLHQVEELQPMSVVCIAGLLDQV